MDLVARFSGEKPPYLEEILREFLELVVDVNNSASPSIANFFNSLFCFLVSLTSVSSSLRTLLRCCCRFNSKCISPLDPDEVVGVTVWDPAFRFILLLFRGV